MRVRWSMILAAGGLAAVAIAAGAQVPPRATPRTELMIVTGSESGTYYAIGRDLKRFLEEVAPDAGIDLAVVPSPGALQNVIDVFRYGSIQLGITQGDVLAYLELYARGDPDVRRAVGGLQLVARLYDEEVYLFARPGIRGLGDLTGKRVDIGPPGSGTTVTALVLLHLAGAEPREVVNYVEISDAVTALRRGRIDAFFRVVGTPAEYLRESISRDHGFVLVPIRLTPGPADVRLAEHYTPTVIPAGAYPWLDHPVDTVKITTAVVTAGAPPGSPACEAIGRLARLGLDNRSWFQQHGHPAWRNLTRPPGDVVNDPRVSPCVTQGRRR
jgi:TRAP transporter TAXI family solute receptor